MRNLRAGTDLFFCFWINKGIILPFGELAYSKHIPIQFLLLIESYSLLLELTRCFEDTGTCISLQKKQSFI